MAAGSLTAAVRLDEPDRLYHGNELPVTGNVVLTFRPSISTDREQQTSEFFGPLKISITFHGRLKSKIHEQNSKNSSTYRGRVPLFSRTVKIFDDSAKIAAGEKWPVPFELSFPKGFENGIVGDWEKDSRFDCRQDQALPPSFVSNYSGFANHYESFIEYRVGVKAVVPHLPVNIVIPEKYAEPLVHYQQVSSAAQRSLEPKQHKHLNRTNISNELLLPEEDRPTGFRQKFKAGLSSNFYPQYNFDWVLKAPQHIYLGQPIPFEIYIRPREKECTAKVVPEVRLSRFVVSLSGSTTVRAEKQFFSSPEASHDDIVRSFKGTLDDPGPFSKAGDWGKTVNTPTVPKNLAPTFSTVNICRVHFMKIHLVFEAAGKTFVYDPFFRVTVLPPLLDSETNPHAAISSAVASSSSQPMDMQQVEDALPRYEESLPQYHEAVGGAAPPPSKDLTPATANAGLS